MNYLLCVDGQNDTYRYKGLLCRDQGAQLVNLGSEVLVWVRHKCARQKNAGPAGPFNQAA
jgi:hypothetical protein